MIHILLAAGSGTRMGPLTSDRPKVLVEVDGRSILEHNFRNLLRVDPAARVCVIAGYAADQVVAFAAAASAWIDVRVVVNAAFARSGPLSSIRAAVAAVEPGAAVTIGNGDTIFEPPAWRALLASAADAGLLCSVDGVADADDVQLRLHGDRILVAAKHLAATGALPVSAGLLRLDGGRPRALLEQAVVAGLADEAASGRPLTWHSAIARLAEEGQAAKAVIVPRAWWWEFDSAECLTRYAEARQGATHASEWFAG